MKTKTKKSNKLLKISLIVLTCLLLIQIGIWIWGSGSENYKYKDPYKVESIDEENINNASSDDPIAQALENNLMNYFGWFVVGGIILSVGSIIINFLRRRSSGLNI